MSDDADRELSALIVREQRGFRVMMYWGVAVLIAIALMSAVLALYYRDAQQEIVRAVAEQAFTARRERQVQNNEIATQRSHIRRISAELRGMVSARPGDAVAAARAYLERGQLDLASEQSIQTAAHAETTQGAERALLQGVANLVAFDRSGESVQARDEALPPLLQEALSAFRQIQNDATLGPLASNGVAFVLSSEALRLSYTQEACDELFGAVNASAGPQGALAPRPLQWRANCERKRGQTSEALRDYAAMLAQSAAGARDRDADYTHIELAMQGYHGVGTTLIAMRGLDANDPNMRAGLAVAERECPTVEQASGSPEMRLAIACLNQAMELRRRMGQNDSQVAGTGENLGFAYLRDNLFDDALRHANRTEEATLSPWNELVRAIAAEHVADGRGETADAARAIVREARSNISFFTPRQFDLCELRRLLNAELHAEAVAIVHEEHPGPDEIPSCAD